MKIAELFANAYTMVMTALGITEEAVKEKKEEENKPWLKTERLFPVEEKPVVKKAAAPKKKRKPALKVSRGEILKAAQDYVAKYSRFPSLEVLKKETNGRATKQRIYKYFKNVKGLRNEIEFSVVKPAVRSVKNRVPGENPKEFLMNDLYQNVISHPEEHAISTIIDKYCAHGYDTYLRHVGIASEIVKELEVRYGIKMNVGKGGRLKCLSDKEYSERYRKILRDKLIRDYCNVRPGFSKILSLKEFSTNSSIPSVRNYIYRIYDSSKTFLEEAEASYQKTCKKAA